MKILTTNPPTTKRMLDPSALSWSEFTVRHATETDVDAILEVEHNAQPAPWSRTVVERELEVEFSNIWVVEQSARIVAFFVLWLVRDEIHILNVAVHSSARRQGIARHVLQGLEEQAVQEATTVISLEVRASNVAAHKLYDGLGFERIAVRPRYYTDNNEDAWVLTKILEEPDVCD